MKNITSHGFGTGAIPSKRDKRDFEWEKIGFASEPFDWSKGYDVGVEFPIKNQFASLSCGGQAVSYYGAVLNAKYDKKLEERSAKFIYAPTHVLNGGTQGRSLVDYVVKSGFGYEVDTPSYKVDGTTDEVFMTTDDITNEAKIHAVQDKAFSYANIKDTANIDSIAQAIRDNSGALIGINGANNGTWLGVYPISPGATWQWRHWVYASGAIMINGKKYIKIANSWGNKIGSNGFQYLSEDWFEMGDIFEAWTIVYNTSKPEVGFKHVFNTNLERGMAGDEVTFLQKALRLEGIFKYPSDTGNYGLVTQDAVYKFQVKYNIAPFTRWLFKGFYCGPSTRNKLNELYS
jgi:hypothetical protein